MRIKYLTTKNTNTMSLARARTWTAWSRVECTNHKATSLNNVQLILLTVKIPKHMNGGHLIQLLACSFEGQVVYIP